MSRICAHCNELIGGFPTRIEGLAYHSACVYTVTRGDLTSARRGAEPSQSPADDRERPGVDRDRPVANTFTFARLVLAIIGAFTLVSPWLAWARVGDVLVYGIDALPGMLIVAGSVAILGIAAASWFRVPSKDVNISPVASGFATVAVGIVMLGALLAIGNSESDLTTGTSTGVLVLVFAAVGMCAALQLHRTVKAAPVTAARSTWTAPTETSAIDESADNTKPCPECAETVKAAAKICRYCRHDFQG